MLLAVVVPLLGAVYLAFLLKVVDGDLVEGTLQKYVFLYWWLFSGMEVDTMFVTMNLGADEAAVRSSLLMSLFSLLNMTGFCCFCLFFRDCGFWSLPHVLSLVQKKSGHKHNYDDKIVVFNRDKLWGPMNHDGIESGLGERMWSRQNFVPLQFWYPPVWNRSANKRRNKMKSSQFSQRPESADLPQSVVD